MTDDEEKEKILFPNKERCQNSDCAFFEEVHDREEVDYACRNTKMAGKVIKVDLTKAKNDIDDDRLCPCWGDYEDRKSQEREEKRESDIDAIRRMRRS